MKTHNVLFLAVTSFCLSISFSSKAQVTTLGNLYASTAYIGSNQPTGDTIGSIVVTSSNSNVIYAAYPKQLWGDVNAKHNILYSTSNHGASWTDVSANLPYWNGINQEHYC
jgi:hypothetical protein